jgi:hypothetical protein
MVGNRAVQGKAVRHDAPGNPPTRPNYRILQVLLTSLAIAITGDSLRAERTPDLPLRRRSVSGTTVIRCRCSVCGLRGPFRRAFGLPPRWARRHYGQCGPEVLADAGLDRSGPLHRGGAVRRPLP